MILINCLRKEIDILPLEFERGGRQQNSGKYYYFSEVEENINQDSDYIIKNIDFSISMDDMSLTAENKEEMQQYLWKENSI